MEQLIVTSRDRELSMCVLRDDLAEKW